MSLSYRANRLIHNFGDGNWELGWKGKGIFAKFQFLTEHFNISHFPVIEATQNPDRNHSQRIYVCLYI